MDVRDYMAEIKKINLLEPEEEATLWYNYKKHNDDDARCQIIESYQPLVFKCIRPFITVEFVMDLVQEGIIGLIEAVERYEPEKNIAFSLYAVHRIKGRIINCLKKEYKGEQFIYSDSLADEQEDIAADINVQEQAEKNFLNGYIQKEMLRLPDKERMVLNSVYLKDQAPQDLAEAMDVSLAHVYRLQKKAVRRLRGMMSKFMHNWH